MAKVIQVIDVDSDGHKVRLDDGRVIRLSHSGEPPQVGMVVVERLHPNAEAEQAIRAAEEAVNGK